MRHPGTNGRNGSGGPSRPASAARACRTRGLSDTEIAEQLFIGEATVRTHLNRTMTQLDLDSHAQAVVVATRPA
ncbi:putative transcriptional regulator [Streptomyces calvus]